MIKKLFKCITASALILFILSSGAAADADEGPDFPSDSLFKGITQYNASCDPDNTDEFIYSPITDLNDKAIIHYYDDNDSEVDPEDISTVKDLMELTVLVSPPEGNYIKGMVFADKDEFHFSGKELNLTTLSCGTVDSADLRLDFSCLGDDAFSPVDSEEYELIVILAPLEENNSYEYSFTDKTFKPEDFSLDNDHLTGDISDEFKLETIDDEAESEYVYKAGYRFGGWRITYSNGSSLLVEPDDISDFSPIMSFSAEPSVNDEILVVILKDKDITFTGRIPAGESFDINDDGCSYDTADYKIISRSGKISPINIVTELSTLSESEDGFCADISIKSLSVETEGNDDPVSFERGLPDWIYTVSAKLTVRKADLSIKAKNSSKPYDGTALTCPEIEAPEGLSGNNIIDYSALAITGSKIDIGTADNIVSGARILSDDSSSAVDVSSFYNVSYVPGRLTVTPPERKSSIVISPSPDPIEKTFRGEGITPDGSGSSFYSISGELYPTDTIEVHSSLYDTPVWEGDVSYYISYYTIYRNNLPLENADQYYDLILDNSRSGLLQINKISITVTADSFTKPFDGNPVSKNGYSLSGTLYEGDRISVNISPSQEITKVGKAANIVSSCVITDSSGRDVSSFYKITLNPGVLEVTPRPLTISVKNVEREYNGQIQTISGTDDIIFSTPLPSSTDSKYRYEMNIEPAGSLKDIGTTDIGLKVNKIFLFDSVENKEVEDITDQFSISVVPGKLTITPRTLTIKTKSVTKAYSGTALTDNTTPEVTGKLEGDVISIRFTGSQTKIGSSSNSCNVIKIVNSDNEDVLKNYKIVYNFGKLTVYSSGSSSGAPLTGDDNHPLFYSVLFIIASSCSVILFFSYKKKSQGMTDLFEREAINYEIPVIRH